MQSRQARVSQYKVALNTGEWNAAARDLGITSHSDAALHLGVEDYLFTNAYNGHACERVIAAVLTRVPVKFDQVFDIVSI